MPASAEYGVWFRRTDVDEVRAMIPGRWDAVRESRLCTLLENEDGVTVSTVEHLMAALEAVLTLRDRTCELPPEIARTIAEAKPVSEPISGAGEADTLSRITVNIGRIEGGLNINTIPDRARAEARNPHPAAHGRRPSPCTTTMEK